MKSISTLKRIGTVLLVLSLMCGMLLTGVALPATAEEDTTVKIFDFTVKDIIPFSGGKYVIGGKTANAWYDFTSSTVTESVTVRDALNANFDLYYNNKDYYAAIPFGSTHSGDPNGSSASFKTLYQNSYLQRGGIASAYAPTSGFDVITAMVPKVDGTQLAYKNFETTFDFDHNNSGAAAIFGFRQQTPGKFVDADGVLNKEQGFVLISKTGVTFGAGKGIVDTMYTTETAKFATAAENKLRVTVKAVNDKLTVKVVGVTSGTVYYDNSDAPATIDCALAGTLAYGITAKKADFGAVSLTYLDGNGVAKDFDTLFNVNKFRADFSDVIAIADSEGKFASKAAITPASTDTAIQNWFNGKFAPFYNRESAEYCALDYVGQNSNAFQTDTGNPTQIVWDLEKSTQSLRFTRTGSGYAGTVLRKGFTLALKTADGSLAKMKNFEAEVDFIVPGSSGRGGVFLSFREKDPGRMQASSGGVFNKEYCGDAVIISDREVNGIVPGNLQDRANANNAIAFANEQRVVESSPHTLYVKVVGNKLTWKVIKIDTKAVIGEGVETLTRDLPAGYISVGCTSQTRKLLDIRVTALGDSGEPVDFDNCASFEFTQKDTIAFANGKYTASGQAWYDFNNTNANSLLLQEKYQSAFDGYYNNKDHYAETPVGTTYAGDPDKNFTAGVKTAQHNLWVQRGWKTQVAAENMGVISSLVPKVDGTPLQYKNFEATTYFRMESANTTALIGFRQQTPGKFVDALNVVNKEQGLIVISATGIAIGAGDDIDNAMYNANTTATFGTAISGDRYIGVTVRVVNNKLTVKVFSSNSGTAYGSTTYYDNSANPVTINYDKAGTIAFGIGRDNGLFGPVSVVHLDAAGAPVSYKVNDENEPAHTCDFATPNYDATGHWNECVCGEKDAVVPHELTYVVDGDKHYQKCDCGYTTEKADHDFTEGDCVCGEQKPNTARVDEDTRIITVKAEEGYQLKAGSLIVTDANGVRYVPTRVGYRESDDASKYEVPAEAAAPYTVDYAFVQPTGGTDAKDNAINVAYLGAQVTENAGGGLRHVHRLNIST
ncbi:MAG: hypothetical protein J6L00_00570, partial [Clostridia bacterium]|nr:hypothetical protein [Clostridia bacterium]